MKLNLQEFLTTCEICFMAMEEINSWWAKMSQEAQSSVKQRIAVVTNDEELKTAAREML